MRPDTPPRTEQVENKYHRTHVKVSQLTSSKLDESRQTRDYNFDLPSQSALGQTYSQPASAFKITPVQAEEMIPAAGKATNPSKYSFSGSALPKTAMKSPPEPAEVPKASVLSSIERPNPQPPSETKSSSLFGSIQFQSEIKSSLIGLDHFDKSSKNFKQTPVKIIQENPESPEPKPLSANPVPPASSESKNKDLQSDIPQFTFTSKPVASKDQSPNAEQANAAGMKKEPSFSKITSEVVGVQKLSSSASNSSPGHLIPVSQKVPGQRT